MNRGCLYILFICLMLFSGCSPKKKTSGGEKFPRLGVVIKIPENFQALPDDVLADIGTLKATTLEVEPFSVNPLYVYADSSGKGLIVISELDFLKDFTPERLPADNLLVYKNNLENYLDSGEVSSEEMGSDDITTLLLAMVFQEDGDDIFLFKGLNYIYPDRFFMIDLYVVNKEITENDVLGYIDMFNSLSVY